MNTRFFNKGFTLIEVLLSLLLLSVILGAIYSTFFLAQKAMGMVDDSLLRYQESRTMLDTIGREIEASVYSSAKKMSLFKIEDRDNYGKQSSRLTFTALIPQRPGLSKIGYYVEEKNSRLILYKEISDPYRADKKPVPAEMIEGLEAFTVEVKEGPNWVRTWNTEETGRGPVDVRITLKIKVKDRAITLYETARARIGRAL